MSVSRIGLVHPPPAQYPSGGDLYDQKLLQHAASSCYPLLSVPWHEGSLTAGSWDLLVWDSLLLNEARRVAEERAALLLHYLPSLDPALDPPKREALQALERRAVARADFVIATGRTLADAVSFLEPGKPVFLCEPGLDKTFLSMRRDRQDRRYVPDRLKGENRAFLWNSEGAAPRRDGESLAFPPDREGSASQPVKLVTVAHLLPAKGHGHLLSILARLAHLPWHWHVVGDDRRSPETIRHLQVAVQGAGLTNRITFHGALPPKGVAALLADSDLFVFPSSFESYGMVLAESVAMGVPVLSNRVGAAEQLIEHGTTGFLANPGDWDGFGKYLHILLVDAELRARLKENLRHVRVRAWDETFADFRAACESMLE